MNYVIIGNSTAAIGCVEGIRQMDKESNIILISSESYHTYSRPLISYLLYGKTDEERMKYRPDSFYKDNGCTLLTGKTVVSIDPKGKSVLLDNGEKIPYDKLLVATGSCPFIPPIEGLERVTKKFTFMSLDDAKALKKTLSPESKVMIMGAGLIGLKCAEGIAHLVKSITVVDLADRILPSVLDQEGAAIVQKHLEKNISFILSDCVQSFEPNQAALVSGKKVPFDVLVVAVGVRPNTNLVSDAGGEVNRGIVINGKCETSLCDVYAAGDCVESHDITIDENRILALLPNAYIQGETAGINMAGGEKSYDSAIPMNAVGFFGLHVITAGSYDGEETIVSDGRRYKKLLVKDGLLKGYIMVGDVGRAGIYTSLIRNQTPLDTIDFELMKQHPQLMAFSRKERIKMLGVS
ncbi:NAD(P)/FAD-dependent oxidoreductase [Fumia xinanensis]|uniref:NAD(P)/FAD-dependent oxidoreductase n=1 Tax=Fumia xinanensis TaxID=2763659 RepID=A0A926E3H2_9FIRM|nr:FAD-dependent oxidoreductase [Fumia xinanensis]MBC8560601.1 NAD(P)/FAD-dependent oxidoreductase [Fumia xinanensis]